MTKNYQSTSAPVAVLQEYVSAPYRVSTFSSTTTAKCMEIDRSAVIFTLCNTKKGNQKGNLKTTEKQSIIDSLLRVVWNLIEKIN